MRKIIIAFSIAFITTLCTYTSDWQFTIGTGLTLPYSRLHAKNGKMGSLMTRNAETHLYRLKSLPAIADRLVHYIKLSFSPRSGFPATVR